MTACVDPSQTALTFVIAGPLEQFTGGYLYDKRVIAELRALGWTVGVAALPGRFPVVDDCAREAFEQALAELPDGTRVVVDGLVLGALPEPAHRHAHRLDLTALVHHPLADETGWSEDIRQALLASERTALAAARRIVTTSRFTAQRLAALGLTDSPVAVVEPGVDLPPGAHLRPTAADAPPGRNGLRGERALSSPCSGSHADPGQPEAADTMPPGTRSTQLLCIATLIPRKAQDVLVAALAEIADLPWQCELVGSLARDSGYVAHVRTAIANTGLDARILLRGELPPEALSAAYLGADVFVFPSHFEGYGMAVAEAIAHGLPVVTTHGGALADTVPPGCGLSVPPGDATALARALRAVLTDDALRARLQAAVHDQRTGFPNWATTARLFAETLAEPPPAAVLSSMVSPSMVSPSMVSLSSARDKDASKAGHTA